MKFDFDTFEFVGLIAPGCVVVVAFALLQPQFFRVGEPAVVIAVAIIAAYVFGHLVAAVGNAATPLFKLIGIHRLESLSNEQWSAHGFIAGDQWERVRLLVRTNLHRGELFERAGSIERETVVKQMYLAIIGAERAQRLTMFDGLYSLSRGLTVSFLLCFAIALAVRQYGVAAFCVVATGLAVYRMRKFNHHYLRELIQQFALLDEKTAG